MSWRKWKLGGADFRDRYFSSFDKLADCLARELPARGNDALTVTELDGYAAFDVWADDEGGLFLQGRYSHIQRETIRALIEKGAAQ